MLGIVCLPEVIAAGVLVWAGVGLLIDTLRCRRSRADILERLQRFQSSSLADEAERWLHRQP